MISLVTARVVRQNEQYRYAASKNEKYLVEHGEKESAAALITAFLAPYSTEPVQVLSVVLQNGSEIIGHQEPDEGQAIYKVNLIEYVPDEKTGRPKRKSHRYFIAASGLHKAAECMQAQLDSLLGDYEITAITKTGIIEIKKYAPYATH